jgi:hypothetical protein
MLLLRKRASGVMRSAKPAQTGQNLTISKR